MIFVEVIPEGGVQEIPIAAGTAQEEVAQDERGPAQRDQSCRALHRTADDLGLGHDSN